MTAEEQVEILTAKLNRALEQLQQTQEQLREAQARIEELEKLKTPAAPFVKANKKKLPENEKKPRKKRDAQ